eukprot:360412_1
MSTCLFLLTILVPILSQDAKPSSSNNCFAHFDKYGSRFDVCNLQLVTGENLQHYKIEDSKNTPNSTKGPPNSTNEVHEENEILENNIASNIDQTMPI